MNRRTGAERNRRIAAAIALVLPILLLGCADDGPYVEDNDRPPVADAAWPQATWYTVVAHQGDTLPEIAARYDVGMADLVRLNGLDAKSRMRAGEVLRIPAHSRDTRVAVMADAVSGPVHAHHSPPKPVAHARSVGRPGAIEVSSLAPLSENSALTNQPDTAPVGKADRAAVIPQQRPATPPRDNAPSDTSADPGPTLAADSPAQFAWPLVGAILSPFGRDRTGGRNDGINIAAKRGEPIHAAATGTVTYVGNELKSYGKLILIEHDDGYFTAYAHADSIGVERGDRVTKGQVIGTAGDTGDVDRPQLHFEIRKGAQPVNPRRLLAAEFPANRELSRE
jgi:murein DD-endopeptidase MepM/ murein hydrolase activator NlpD